MGAGASAAQATSKVSSEANTHTPLADPGPATGEADPEANTHTPLADPGPATGEADPEAKVIAAEKAVTDALERATLAVKQAKALRLERLRHHQRIYLRPFRSSIIRFLKGDKDAAMARYAWYRRQVKRRKCPGYRLNDEGVWGIVSQSDTRWACYLEPRSSDGVYTLHSQFGTRYGSGETENVFQGFEDFLAKFSSPWKLDEWAEIQLEDSDDDQEQEIDEEEEDDEEDEDEEDDDGEEEEDANELMYWAAWREEQKRAEQGRDDESEGRDDKSE